MGKRNKYKPGETIVETRRVIRLGTSHYISLPPEFVVEHNIQPRDLLPIVANRVMKIYPIAEEEKALPKSEKKPNPLKTPCPHCQTEIFQSALESHIKNYCLKAPARVA